MPYLQQLIQLLSQDPGNVVYHLVSLFAVQATLGLTLWQWRRTPEHGFTRRLAWAALGLLSTRLAIALAVVLTADPNDAAAILPPLEQALDAASVVLIVWALSPHPANQPRLGDVLVIIVLLFVGSMYIFYARDWMVEFNRDASISYNSARQASVWGISQLVILGIGIILVIIRRERQWSFRVAILATLFAAHVAQLLSRPELIPTDTNVAYFVRLGNLVALPLLAVLAYRNNVVQLLASDGAERASIDLAETIQFSRRVIDSLESEKTIRNGLILAQQVLTANLVGLGIISGRDTEQLSLTCIKRGGQAGALDEEASHVHGWALGLSSWPAIRLALQQRQQVELVPDGLGARQLHEFYQELGVADSGALLIEPLLAGNHEIGVLLLASPSSRHRWSSSEKALSNVIGDYLAQSLLNAQLYEKALQESSTVAIADETVVSGRIIALEEERQRALAEVQSLTSRWQHAEARLAAESQRVLELSSTMDAMQRFDKDDRVRVLEEEIAALRESLAEAEEAVAMAAAGEGGLSADWVLRAVTRYSGELENAQARISQLETRLAQQEETQTEALISTLAQELRTPLTTLAGYTDLLLAEKMGILGSRQLSLLRRVEANIQHMATALDQIIQLASEEQPRLADTVRVDVREAIESAIDAVAPQLRLKGLRLDLDLDEGLPEVRSDSDAFYQIVANLLNNACTVSMDGSRLSIRAHRDSSEESDEIDLSQSESFLHLAVSDTGGSRSQELVSLVLEARRRPGDEAILTDLANGGKSLSRVVSLVSSHGGRTWVDYDSDIGSTLSVLLPLSGNGVSKSESS